MCECVCVWLCVDHWWLLLGTYAVFAFALQEHNSRGAVVDNDFGSWQVPATHFRRTNNWGHWRAPCDDQHNLHRAAATACATRPIFICLPLFPHHFRAIFFFPFCVDFFFLFFISFVAFTLCTFDRLRCHLPCAVCRVLCAVCCVAQAKRSPPNTQRFDCKTSPTDSHLLSHRQAEWLGAIYASCSSLPFISRWCWISFVRLHLFIHIAHCVDWYTQTHTHTVYATVCPVPLLFD